MSWARVDDGWWCHAKVATLSLAARGLWVTALSWCAQQRRSDIPRGVLPMLTVGDRKSAALAAELTSQGLWDASEGGWTIHDHDEYQREPKPKASPEQRAEHAAKAARARWGARGPDAREHARPMLGACSEHAQAMPGAMRTDAHAQCPSMPPDPIPIPSHPDPDPSQAPDPERAGLTAGAYRQTDETAEQLSATLMVPLDELREVEGLVIARLLASGAQVKGPARRYAQTALLEALRDPKRRGEARQAIAARREEAAREESRDRSEAEALERIAADKREANRRAALRPDQREVEDALRTLERSEYTLAHPGLPLSATAPARAAKRKAEAILAKHGVPVPGGAKRSA